MLQTQSIGARMLSKHFHKEDLTKKREDKALPPEKSASELLQEHKRIVVNATPLHRRPQLGRGMGGDGLIYLSDRRRTTTANATTKASLAKVSRGSSGNNNNYGAAPHVIHVIVVTLAMYGCRVILLFWLRMKIIIFCLCS